MKRRIAVASGFVLAATLPAIAVDHEIQRRDLERGTELVLVEDHRVPLVYAVLEFPVGSWSPWATDSHAKDAFAIQLYDREGSLRSRADELSLDLYISMSSHAARLRLSCLRDDLEPALVLVRDVLQNRDFDRHELKRWRKNAKLQWDGSKKQPQFVLDQATARLLYRRDDPRRRPYEKPPPGINDLDKLAAARDIVLRIPGRVIGFAGDLALADAERLATGLLPPVTDDPPDGLEPVLGPMRPMDEVPDQTVKMSRIQQSFFGYVRHSLTYDDPRYPAFLVADHVLGGHFFSRMYEALRHEGGETYGARTKGRGGVYSQGYAMSTFTRRENTEATEQKLREVLRKLHADGITEEEREAAVGFLRGRLPFSRQAPRQVLDRFLTERRHGLPIGFYDDQVERAARVSLEEINALIREFYDPSGFAMLKVVPK